MCSLTIWVTGYSGDMFPAELECIMDTAYNPFIGLTLAGDDVEYNAVFIAVSADTGRVFIEPVFEYDRGTDTAQQNLNRVIEFAMHCADKNGAEVVAEFRFLRDLPKS
jgi:hypothetical protein